MPRLTTKRVVNFLQRSELSFEGIADPRALRSSGQERLGPLLRLLVLGIASDKRRLRSLESLSRDMTPKMHRAIGLKKRRVSDTTFYELLARVEPEKFGEVVAKQLRQDLDRKAITTLPKDVLAT